ncbi:hypothetical protein ACJJTC_008947 [Scirpophaga incertulas]
MTPKSLIVSGLQQFHCTLVSRPPWNPGVFAATASSGSCSPTDLVAGESSPKCCQLRGYCTSFRTITVTDLSANESAVSSVNISWVNPKKLAPVQRALLVPAPTRPQNWVGGELGAGESSPKCCQLHGYCASSGSSAATDLGRRRARRRRAAAPARRRGARGPARAARAASSAGTALVGAAARPQTWVGGELGAGAQQLLRGGEARAGQRGRRVLPAPRVLR